MLMDGDVSGRRDKANEERKEGRKKRRREGGV